MTSVLFTLGRCVLMFCLGRHDFPVDTHVWKIAIALGWVPKVRAA